MTIKDTSRPPACARRAAASRGTRPRARRESVRRLRDAGAVIFGKTNTPTLAGDVQTYNPIFGVTNNPWDTARTSGGSSGGAAAAVATGLTSLELGSDIGGSIRMPSNWCGVYGHKPTYGIVPQRGHIPRPPGTLAEYDLGVMGPIARSADDLALLLDVLAGPAGREATGWRLALPPPRATALRDLRIAAWLDDPAYPVDPEVAHRARGRPPAALRAAGVHRRAGASGRAGRGAPHLRAAPLADPLGGWRRRGSTARALAARRRAEDDGALARSGAATLRHRDWIFADERREQLRALMADFFRDVDVLLCRSRGGRPSRTTTASSSPTGRSAGPAAAGPTPTCSAGSRS